MVGAFAQFARGPGFGPTINEQEYTQSKLRIILSVIITYALVKACWSHYHAVHHPTC
jgi:hypothetical protein